MPSNANVRSYIRTIPKEESWGLLSKIPFSSEGRINEIPKSSMFEYYAQRAPEFDEIYLGGGPASIADPDAYRGEVEILSGIVERNCSGRLIDIGCGTAFWLPHYARSCSQIVLFDQSEEMLAQARNRAVSAGVADRTSVLVGDALSHDFGGSRFDTILVAFLMSHLTAQQEGEFLRTVRSLVHPSGRLLILDSVWNEARALTRRKEGPQKRTLANGREFDIYKKYFDQRDLSSMREAYDVDLTVEHFGTVFFAAIVTTRKDTTTIDP